MQRLTHKKENGIKRGYWSPNKKQELVDRLAMYEDREDAKDTNVPGKWILCSERLPEKPAVGEYGYLLRVACIVQLSAYWDGSKWIDAEDNVVFPFAWMPLPEPYRENEKNE